MSNNQPNIKSEPSIKSEPTTTTDVDTQALNLQKVKLEASSTPSASGPPKRTFAPNIAITRTKKEVKQEPDQSDKSTNKRRPPGPNLNAARGGRGGRHQQNLIQSHSIFEAGPAESTKRFGGKQDSTETYSKVAGPTGASGYSAQSSGSQKKASSDPYGHYKSLDIEESLLVEEFKEDETPVYIKLKHDIKEENTFEIPSDSKSLIIDESIERDAKLLRDIFNLNLDSDFVQKEKLILFQLPENLQLNELAEGQIGKIRLRKSGRLELCINNDKLLNVSLSVSGPFLQDAVALELAPSIDGERAESGKMTSLGHVLNKIVCSPRF